MSSSRRLAYALALTVLAYTQGLFGGYAFDDFWNIVENPALRALDQLEGGWLVAAFSSHAGMFRRPVSMLSFALNYQAFGIGPLSFKVINLLIHLGCGALIYALAARLAPTLLPQDFDSRTARGLALFAAAAWLLHPLNVSGVLYVVQRMNQLASLFVLAGLLCYVAGRQRQLRQQSGFLLGICGMGLFGVLAVLSKENGALIVAYALVIEIACFGFAAATPPTRRAVRGFFVLFLALPVLAGLSFVLTHPEWVTSGYSLRNFTLGERLLTEPRVLLFYVQMILVPWPGWMSIYHDDFSISHGLLDPPATALTLLFWGVAAGFALLRLRRRAPALFFGLAWFLVGHSMESSFLGLELIFEHRNYLPMAGLLFGLGAAALAHLSGTRMVQPLAIAAIVLLFTGTLVRSHQWADPMRLAVVDARNHPNSARSQYDAAREIGLAGRAAGRAAEAAVEARPYLERAMRADPLYVPAALSYLQTFPAAEPASQAAVEDLIRRVREAPMLPGQALLAFLVGVADGAVALSPQQMDNLVSAALENRSVSPPLRAMILNHYGRYQYLALHNEQAAVSLTLAAVEADPDNPFLHINLANLASELGNWAMAFKHAQQAQTLDPLGLHAGDIRKIIERLHASGAVMESQRP